MLLLASSSNAEAMLCDVDDETLEEGRWSSQLAPLPPIVVVRMAKRLPQRCESFADVNCDVGVPDGEPRTSPTVEIQRQAAGLLAGALPLPTSRSARLLRARTATKKISKLPKSIFRPPRQS
jgi:hypothetical protein